MTKKSAAKLQIAEKPKAMTEEEKAEVMEKELATAKTAVLASLEIQINQCERFDSLLAIHDSYARFGIDGLSIMKATEIAAKMKALLIEVRDIIEEISLVEMVVKDFTNPIDKFVPSERRGTWDEVLEDAMMFSAIRPWGEQMDTLHGQLLMKAEEIGFSDDAR